MDEKIIKSFVLSSTGLRLSMGEVIKNVQNYVEEQVDQKFSPKDYPVKFDKDKKQYIIIYDVKMNGKRKRGKLKISIKDWHDFIKYLIIKNEAKDEEEPSRVIRL